MTDFGLARFGPDAGLTVTGDLLGTLRYMAPEQALAQHGLVDHRTDVYSLGRHALRAADRPPGRRRGRARRRCCGRSPSRSRRRRGKLDKAIPAELETIILKALAKNPAERYATAGSWPTTCGASWRISRSGRRRARSGRAGTALGPAAPGAAAVYGLLVLVLALATAGGAAAWQWQVAEAAQR